jgi:GNAT superfamily N-acetyltransferase
MGLRFMGTVYRGKAADPAAMARTATWLIDEDPGTVFVSDDNGTLTGMIGLFIYNHPISGLATATEMFWWVEPTHRGHGLRLLNLATAWAITHGAHELQMIAPSPEVAQLYERLGYSLVETSYARNLHGTNSSGNHARRRRPLPTRRRSAGTESGEGGGEDGAVLARRSRTAGYGEDGSAAAPRGEGREPA